jgi:hypothetical protein
MLIILKWYGSKLTIDILFRISYISYIKWKKESVMEQFITLGGIIFLSGVIGYIIGSRSAFASAKEIYGKDNPYVDV